MKIEYDIKNMRRAPHPLQDKIDSGEWKLIDHMDVSDIDFEISISALSEDKRKFAIECRQLWKGEQLIKEISEHEKSCRNQLPAETVELFEKIKLYISANDLKNIFQNPTISS